MAKLKIISEKRETIDPHVSLVDFIINMGKEYVYVLDKTCMLDIMLYDKEMVIERFDNGEIMVCLRGESSIMWLKDMNQSQDIISVENSHQYVIFDMTLRGRKYKPTLSKANVVYLKKLK